MKETTVHFQSPDGHRLFGILHMTAAEKQCERAVLMVVGGPQTRVGSHRLYVQLARFLCAQGYAVLRFDYEGIGDSEGPWRGYKWAAPAVRAAQDFLVASLPHLDDLTIWALCDGAAITTLFAGSETEPSTRLLLCNPYLHSERLNARAMLKHYYIARLTERDFWSKVFAFHFNPITALQAIFSFANRSQKSGVRHAK